MASNTPAQQQQQQQTRNKSNPWGSPSVAATERQQQQQQGDPQTTKIVSSIAAIMQQQQQENEDDRQLRLAIEASLRDSQPLAAEASPIAETTTTTTTTTNMNDDDLDDDMRLALALSLSTTPYHQQQPSTSPSPTNLSPSSATTISHALREASDADEAKSLTLALQLQQDEEDALAVINSRRRHDTGNVRTVARLPDKKSSIAAPPRRLLSADDAGNSSDEDDDDDDDDSVDSGYRMNDQRGSQWARSSPSTITHTLTGEIRTKHDVQLKHRSNAARLLSLSSKKSSDATTKELQISDGVYNSFRRHVSKTTQKGVAKHGTGRAEGSYGQKTRGGAMDDGARMVIVQAINKGLLERCEGSVKEGKEAVVYYGVGGEEVEGGGDVAVKVFKRIREFKGRGVYVDGDPRYWGRDFGKVDGREKLEMWAEKEYRNLIRAHRAGVPTPRPLFYKSNVLFMSFIGDEGHPAPQLRDLSSSLKPTSHKWGHFYIQIMIAIRRLYHCARLVHGDLSEYNVLIGAERDLGGVGGDVKACLIDFGQAVEIGHPRSEEFLRRDVEMVGVFFKKKGVTILTVDEAVDFVTETVDGEDWEVEDGKQEDGVAQGEDEEDYVVVDEVNDGCEGSSKSQVEMNKMTDMNEEIPVDVEKNEGDDNDDNVDVQVNKEMKAWRHIIPTWDDEVEYQRLEEKLQAKKHVT